MPDLVTFFRRAVPMGLAAALIAGSAALADWRKDFTEVRLGTAASEVDDDTVRALEALSVHLTETFGVTFVIQQATDYAAVTEALRAGNLEFTRMGGANYALAYRIMGDGILPLALDVSETGRGYSAMVVVRADSPFESLDDLEGHSLAFVDPNSASGYVAPNYFMSRAGYDPEKHFSSVVFAGSHDNAVIGVVNGQFDAAATYRFNEENSAVTRLDARGLVDAADLRTIWVSDLLANPLWVGRADLPEDLIEDFTAALIALPEAAPDVWELVRQGRLVGYARTSHAEYQPMIDMTEWNRKQRRED